LITVSIVSHGHGAMVGILLTSLLECPAVSQIIVIRNIPESFELIQDFRVLIIDNAQPKGFGANHNMAFKYCQQPLFCVLNPDIVLEGDPFPDLMRTLNFMDASVVSPIVKSPHGLIEDSVRYFPTPVSLVRKVFGLSDGRYDLHVGQTAFFPEWVAGMFMLFRSSDFASLGGFDERFFLYYEDVDICIRAWKQHLKVAVCPDISVIHNARRASHRNLRHLRWHLQSLLLYFWMHCGRLPGLPEFARD